MLLAGAVAAALRATCLRVWTMPSDDPLLALSVVPTLEAGDILILFRLGTPGFGELVRCADPQAPEKYVVGRILGEQGDRVETDQATVSVNDTRVRSLRSCDPSKWVVRDPNTGEAFDLSCEIEEAGGSEYTRARATRPPGQVVPFRVNVPDGHVFLASDDRYYHDDSRDFGTVPKPSCDERIVFRLVGPRGWFDQSRRLTLVR
jgi:signal peptidase I